MKLVAVCTIKTPDGWVQPGEEFDGEQSLVGSGAAKPAGRADPAPASDPTGDHPKPAGKAGK